MMEKLLSEETGAVCAVAAQPPDLAFIQAVQQTQPGTLAFNLIVVIAV